jgi:hypothetical protein
VIGTTRYPEPDAIVVPAEYRTQGGTKGPHNIPFAIDGVDVPTFYALHGESRDADDFVERLRGFAREQ